MIYTSDNRLLFKTSELADYLNCSYTYLTTLLDRFNFPRIKYKDRGKHIEVNNDFIYKMTDFLKKIHNKKSEKVRERLNQLITP